MTEQKNLLSEGEQEAAEESRELSTAARPSEETGKALSDLRAAAMAVPVEVMEAALTEYSGRRKFIRQWLKLQMTQGIHYGYPPGCTPPNNRPSEEQWQYKPCLYKAGAEFVIDLMGLRGEWTADMEAWQQIGSPKDTFVRRCVLYSKVTGEIVGEGSGARKIGEKKMGTNATIKMADKSATVAAVLNSYGLSDLFTQDTDDGETDKPKHENPPENPAAPRAPSRDERSMQSKVVALGDRFKAACEDAGEPPPSKEDFINWAHDKSGEADWNPADSTQWTDARLAKCNAALGGQQ